jgi:hypothetical protein
MKGLSEPCPGTIYQSLSIGWFFFHALRRVCVSKTFRLGFQLVSAVESTNSCPGLSHQLQVQWGESKEDLNCSFRSCPHCSNNTQSGLPLEFANFSSPCSQFNSRGQHSGSIGDYGSYNHSVYSVYCLGFSPQVLPNVPLEVQKIL